MDILFNELSLCGQFNNFDDFVARGLHSFLGVMKRMEGVRTLVLKKSDFWSRSVTKDHTLHTIMHSTDFRKTDETRRLKLALIGLTVEPFWDSHSKQDNASIYMCNAIDVSGSSIAEASERDRVLISFECSDFSSDPLIVSINKNQIDLKNLTNTDAFVEYLWSVGEFTFEDYIKSKFSLEKLNFSHIDEMMGFDQIESSEFSVFIDAFRTFNCLSWTEIYSHTGLNYKEYKGVISPRYKNVQTFKFRVTQKIRCHGYRDGESFIVIGFELDHKLSDRG